MINDDPKNNIMIKKKKRQKKMMINSKFKNTLRYYVRYVLNTSYSTS